MISHHFISNRQGRENSKDKKETQLGIVQPHHMHLTESVGRLVRASHVIHTGNYRADRSHCL